MDKKVDPILDFQSGSDRDPLFTLEFLLLSAFTLAPLTMIFLPTDAGPFESRGWTILWCIWVGSGAILPWRYVRRGDHPLWAGLIGTFASLLLLWTVSITLIDFLRHLMP